jgi:peptidoglycan/xylan/chitin deacetylase (PgdA/CDA1 family)
MMNIIHEQLKDKGAGLIIEKIGCVVNPLLLNFRNENNQLLIFYFHGLFDSLKQKNLNHIDPQNNMIVSQFVDFIEYFLSHKYKFIKPEDLIAGLTNDHPYAMISFDDGYFNNMLAIEILNRYKIPAVIFITTRNMIENRAYWWDIIYKYRTKQGVSLEKIRSEQRYLKCNKHQFIDNYIEQTFGTEAIKPWSDIDRPFNGTEIKNLSINPYISFGSHTHNHSILIICEPEEIREEFRKSRKILLNLTGSSPISMAFPNGDFNKLTLKVAEEEGFRYAFTTEPKQNRLPLENKNLICLGRFMTNTTKVKKYGGFCRLGYEPDMLYSHIRLEVKSILKGKKE